MLSAEENEATTFPDVPVGTTAEAMKVSVLPFVPVTTAVTPPIVTELGFTAPA